MSHFVEVTSTDSSVQLINLDNVIQIIKYAEGSRVHFVDGNLIEIKEQVTHLISANNSIFPKFK